MAAFVDETTQNDEDLAATIARRGASDRAFGAATDAFERLYRRHAPLLLAFIAARVRASDCDRSLRSGRLRPIRPDGGVRAGFRAGMRLNA